MAREEALAQLDRMAMFISEERYRDARRAVEGG